MIHTKRLIDLRKQSNLLQKEVANYLSVGRTTYAKYETGDIQPPNDAVIKLANYYNVTTDYLLGESDDPTPPGEKKEAPPISFKKMEELYIQMLAEEEGTTVDKLNLSEDRRAILHKLILSLLAE